ncbi:hypothetical protein H9P43_005945 [Blastocladiella emersonii ATCC 22665]|nr:hypothetical protein H9P43_005945 [Blastocladiella emersonii ATCC 22665]
MSHLDILRATASNDVAALGLLLAPLSPDEIGLAQTEDGKSALHLACLLGLENALNVLLHWHAPINAADKHGNTPLHLAVSMDHVACASRLLAAGALPFRPLNAQGHSPYALAMASDAMRRLFTDHVLAAPMDLATEASQHALRATLPTDVAELQDLVLALAVTGTRFEAAARTSLHTLVADKHAAQAAAAAAAASISSSAAAGAAYLYGKLGASPVAAVDGDPVALQMQYLHEENEHLAVTAAALRRHVRALERDVEARDAAFRAQIAQLADAHRKELHAVRTANAQAVHELHRQLSLRSLKSVVHANGSTGASSSSRAPSIVGSPVATDALQQLPEPLPAVATGHANAVVPATEHVAALAELEATNLQLAERVQSLEASNSALERDLDELRKSIPTLRENLYRQMMQENDAVQAETDDRDANQGLVVFVTVGGEKQLKAAVPEKLVERLLLGHPVDYQFRTTFLLVFRDFMSPDQLLDQIEATYLPQNSKILLRIGDVLYDWMSRFWVDFNGAFLKRVMSFLHDRLVPDDQTAIVPRIEELVQRKLENPLGTPASPPPPLVPLSHSSTVTSTTTSLLTGFSTGSGGTLHFRRSTNTSSTSGGTGGGGPGSDAPKPILPKYLRRAATPALVSDSSDSLPGVVGAHLGSAPVLGLSTSGSGVIDGTGATAAGENGGANGGGGGIASSLAVSTSWLPRASRGASGREVGVRLADLEMIEVARQLTLVEADLFRGISPMELVGLKWLRKDKEDAAPTLLRMTRWSNHVVKWVVSEVVAVRDVKARALVMERFILLAAELAKLNNYNGVKEILAGLASSSLYRLKKTKALIPRKSVKLLDSLNARMSPELNHKTLRALIRSADPPVIPFPGVYQTDLVFVDTVTRTHLEGGLVNFQRCHKMAAYVLEFQELQDNAWYNLEPVPELQAYIADYRVLDEDAAYARSLACEAR